MTNISGASSSQQYWKLDVPAGKTSLKFVTSGGTGDADMYVQFGTKPTTTSYQCRPYLTGNNETCSFTSPERGHLVRDAPRLLVVLGREPHRHAPVALR